MSQLGASAVQVDPITVEVVRAALNAAAERMRITMIKTAYNHIISESDQLRCGIFDVKAERFGGFEIEDEVEPRRLLDRQIAWLLTF